MNIIYFYSLNKDLNYGPNKKVFSQCIHLIKSGIEVNLFLVGAQETSNLNLDYYEVKKILSLGPPVQSNMILKIKRQYELRKILIDLIKKSPSSNIIYLRYPYPFLYMLFPIRKNTKKCKIVSEHNTIEHREFWITGSCLSLLADLLAGSSMRCRADGIVGVTNEITAYEVKRSGDPRKPHITIGNGIEVNRIKLRRPPGFNEQELRLLCVATFSSWHGIDRILRGFALYKGKIKLRFYIVGDGKDIPNLRQTVKHLKLIDNVIFTGPLSDSLLDYYFNISHLAVGSLGLHRMGMKEASVLKAREYCARGIPFLYGCSDPDFPDDFPYIKKVSGDESYIDIEDVVCFAKKVYSDPQHHLRMRAYAEENLDWSAKMKKLKKFCESLFI